MSSLYDDPRWVALHSGLMPCPACGEKHDGLFDLVCDKPDAWTGSAVATAPAAGGSAIGDLLSDDVCVIGDNYYLRADLDLPVTGAPGKVLTLGLWATVSPTDFDRYVARLDAGPRLHIPPFFGWLANRVAGYPDTLNVACRLSPRLGQAVAVTMLESGHPLTVEQRGGITFSRILDLYALNGHDVRTELLAPEPQVDRGHLRRFDQIRQAPAGDLSLVSDDT